MDQNTTNPMPSSQAPLQPKSERKVGPIIGALIIILVLVIAALYFFSQRLNNTEPANTTGSETSASVTSDVSAQNTQTAQAAPSDDVASIQTDLDGTLKDVDYSF